MKLTVLLLLATTTWVGARTPGHVVIASDTVLSGDLVVDDTATFVIKPGVTLSFAGYHGLTVKGLLIAEGTRDAPIVITCLGRPRGAMGEPCWQGINIIGPKSNAVFRHCRIEGAYRNLISESAPLFDSCEIAGNHYGLYCTQKSRAHIKNCRIHRNSYGIAVDFASPMILDNTITDNIMGVHMLLSSQLIAGRNVITGNQYDTRSDSAFGQNRDVLTVKRLWDLMRQIY